MGKITNKTIGNVMTGVQYAQNVMTAVQDGLSIVNSATSQLGKNLASPSEIYKLFTNDFPFPGQSYADKSSSSFRKQDKGEYFMGRFDMPTYVSFRLEFVFDDPYRENVAAELSLNEKWNSLPHPFLFIHENTDYSEPDDNVVSQFSEMLGLYNYDKIANSVTYSAYDYLKNYLGERKRAELLSQFVKGLKDIQDYYPFYFKSISGLSGIFKTEPKKGRRIPEDRATITIECHEALDMRMAQLINYYQDIAYDNYYQRWVLPDMMRFFRMNIYITEMRLFHRPKKGTSLDTFTLMSDIMNEMMPTIKIELEQCEFDITDNNSQFDTVSSSKGDALAGPKLKIKVGNARMIKTFPLNKVMKTYIEANSLDDEGIAKRDNNFVVDDYQLRMDATTTKYKDYVHNNTYAGLTGTTLNRFGHDLSEKHYQPSNRPFNANFSSTKSVLEDMYKTATDIYNMSTGGTDKDVANKWTEYTNPSYYILKNLELLDSDKVSGMEKLRVKKQLLNTFTSFGQTIALGASKATGNMSGSDGSKMIQSSVISAFNMLQTQLATNGTSNSTATSHNRSDLNYLVDILGDITNALINQPLPNSDAEDAKDQTIQAINDLLVNYYSEAIADLDNGYVDQGLYQDGYHSTATERNTINDCCEQADYHSEAFEDNDHGYVDQGLQSSPYVSTATDSSVISNFGLSQPKYHSEAVEDLDKGYVDQGLEQDDYHSTATERDKIDDCCEQTEYHSEAVEDLDNGYVDQGLSQPGYHSTATENTNIKNFDMEQPEYHSEAVEDLDKGYVDQGLSQPGYHSTATEKEEISEFELSQPEYHSEAVEDLDNGYVNQGLSQPGYHSTATESDINELGLYQPEYHSEAVEDNDHGYVDQGLSQPGYHSTATESEMGELGLSQPKYHSEAVEDLDKGYVDQGLSQPGYHSTATENDNIAELGLTKAEYHSEANEDLDKGYVDQGLSQPGYHSTATEGKLNEFWLPSSHYESTATSRDSIDGTMVQPEYHSEATERQIDKNTVLPNADTESKATSRDRIEEETDEVNEKIDTINKKEIINPIVSNGNTIYSTATSRKKINWKPRIYGKNNN